MIIGQIIVWSGELSAANLRMLRRQGLMPCDGRVLRETKHPQLFKCVQDNFRLAGEILNPGFFRIPDLRGRVAIGSGKGHLTSDRLLGSYLGQENVTLTIDEMPSHSHTISPLEVGHTVNGNGNTTRIDADDGHPWNNLTYRLKADENGGGKEHNNMQPSLAVQFLIRYKVPKKLVTFLTLTDDEYEDED